jgi:hypothetical protein
VIDENRWSSLRQHVERISTSEGVEYAQMVEDRGGLEVGYHALFFSDARAALQDSEYQPWFNVGVMLATYLTGLLIIVRGISSVQLPDLRALLDEGLRLPNAIHGDSFSLLHRIAVSRPWRRDIQEWLEVLPPALRARFDDEYALDDTGWPFFVYNTVAASLDQPIQHPVAEEREPVTTHRYLFRKDGAVFEVQFEGEAGKIDAKLFGAKYIFELLQHPNRDHSAVALAGRVDSSDKPDKQELLEARKKCEERIKENAYELDRAKRDNDLAAVDRLKDERLQLVAEIRRMTGLGGRLKEGPGSDPAETARVAVTNAINRVIDKCKTAYALPRLAEHLDDAISTGKTCAYRPADPAPDWHF